MIQAVQGATPTATTAANRLTNVLADRGYQRRVINLDLLGLVVSLNKVELDISANPVGTLGTLFCQLAGTPTTTTATATTTTTTGPPPKP